MLGEYEFRIISELFPNYCAWDECVVIMSRSQRGAAIAAQTSVTEAIMVGEYAFQIISTLLPD